jgi:hypothetical protein
LLRLWTPTIYILCSRLNKVKQDYNTDNEAEKEAENGIQIASQSSPATSRIRGRSIREPEQDLEITEAEKILTAIFQRIQQLRKLQRGQLKKETL